MTLKRKKNLAEIRSILRNIKNELISEHGIERIGVFGSYINGSEKEGSDLDLLVDFKPDVDIGILKFVEIENYLSDMLGVKVDLVERSALKPRISKRILKEVVYA